MSWVRCLTPCLEEAKAIKHVWIRVLGVVVHNIPGWDAGNLSEGNVGSAVGESVWLQGFAADGHFVERVDANGFLDEAVEDRESSNALAVESCLTFDFMADHVNVLRASAEF